MNLVILMIIIYETITLLFAQELVQVQNQRNVVMNILFRNVLLISIDILSLSLVKIT